ncbi:hypothetical protein FRC03_005736 [Tulasnella sp. 419]|nr:hypothetical protein FRC03_005736 [Tulasnella sp. 419]
MLECIRRYSLCITKHVTSFLVTAKSTLKTTSTPKTSSSTSKSAIPSETPSHRPVKYWFSFGDSYTQTGFDVNGTLPNDANPFGNHVYPGYTACGMVPNWIDYDTIKYNTSKVYTYNFAYWGATIDANLVPPYLPTVKSLTDQVNSFLTTVGPKPASTPWKSSNSIFSFFIGINDIGNSWYQSGDRDAYLGKTLPRLYVNSISHSLTDKKLDAYFALVQKVYDIGGRNFLFINVPGVNRSPLMLAQPETSQEGERVVIEGFNTKLAARAASFRASHGGTKSWVYDAYSKLVDILDHPAAYGLRDASSYGSDADVAWCNDYHISPRYTRYTAKE